jgi:subtilisin family serine protease/putative cell wall-binding protein
VNVRWRAGTSSEEIKAAAKRFGFKTTRTSKIGWAQLTPTVSGSPGALARSLRQARLVTDAKPAVRMKAFDFVPNDPLFASQWALLNTGQGGGTAGADISATEAWSQTTGSHDVIVAVVDQGVNWAHPDLKNNMWFNTAEIPNNETDDDGNGYEDDVRGWDFYNWDNTVFDLSDGDRHGTHVAGIIGAESDNGIGMAGLNQHVRIMPLKFIGGDGWGEDYGAAEAIVYAVDHKATVINCSWGGGDSDVLKDAVDYAASRGVILSVAAGNEYSDNDNPDWASYPASYDTTNIVSVAASDRDDGLAEWSNYGEDSVDLAAPGVDITSTMPAEQAGFYTDALTFKTVFLPLQAEIMEPAAARDALISGAVSQLGETTDTPIFVVDDSAAKVTSETQGVRLGVYTAALAAAGFPNVTTWVTDDAGTPTQAAMDGKIVVWFTGKSTWGWYDDPSLTYDEQYAIASFLDAGGRCVLISGEAATELQDFGGMPEDLDLIGEYFGARWTDYEYWGREFEGRSTSKLAGVGVTIPEKYADPESEDNLWPTASDAVTRYEYGNGTTSIMYTSQFAPLSGTSMAAPHVTGAIALLKAKFPSSSPDELVARILNTADRKPAFAGKTVTGGRLNVAAAMSSYPGRVSITAPKKGDYLHTGSASTLRWTPAVAGAEGATFTAQVGMPFTPFENDFEDGTLGTFEEPTSSGSPWSASTEATAVHSGGWGAKSGALPPSTPAPELGEDWYYAGVSVMETTITVPEGGGDLSFNWRMPESDGWDTLGWLNVDEFGGAVLDTWELDDPSAWTKVTYRLTAGDHAISFWASNYTMETSDVRLYIDDITLTSHNFTDLGSAGAAATSLDFTVPSEVTDDAWFRVQSHLNGVDSAWATAKGVRLVDDAVAPSAPSSLTLTPDLDGGVGIEWTNPADSDFDHVLVLSSTDHMPSSRDDSAVVSYEGTGTSAAFGPVVDGEHVYVSAWAEDTSGNWSSAASADVVATDRTAPSPVRSLRVVQPMPGLPTVLWAAAPEGCTATVLRSYTATPTVDDPDAMAVDADRGSAIDWYIDPDATQVFYTVYLTDESGNVSAPRSTRVLLDYEGIAGTLSVESTRTDPLTRLPIVEAATAWVNADVTNATQMRVSVDGEIDPDADWVPFMPRFQVEFMPIHGEHSVAVELRGSSQEIPTSLTASALVMLRNPLAPRNPTAERWNTGIKLRWDVPADSTLASYRLEEGPTVVGPWLPVALPRAGNMAGAFTYVAGLTPGLPHFFRVTAIDILGREGEPSQVVSAAVGVGTRRFSGADRAITAAAASNGRFSPRALDSAGSDTVVIASRSNYTQALAANSIAGRYGASVLLAGSSLPPATIGEIQRLGVHKALVVGTNAAVSPAVDAALKGLGLKVERITGSDSYDVAAKVARRMATSVMGSRDALVVRGTSSDMCSLMPIAYSSGRPVVVVRKNSIPSAFKTFLTRTPLSSVTVIGGPGAVSKKVFKELSRKASARRVWGTTAADTAAKLAAWGVDNGLASWDNVSIANPAAWSQNLNIGAASRGGVVLHTSRTRLTSVTASTLRRNSRSIDAVSVFGGTGSVATKVKSRICTAMSIPASCQIADPDFSFGPPDDEDIDW